VLSHITFIEQFVVSPLQGRDVTLFLFCNVITGRLLVDTRGTDGTLAITLEVNQQRDVLRKSPDSMDTLVFLFLHAVHATKV
jgi:hypothetical protein